MMKILRLALMSAGWLFCQLVTGQELPSRPEVIATLKLVNDHWVATHPDPGGRDWARAVYFTGNLDLYKIYPYSEYVDYATGWAEKHNWSIGSNTTVNADQQCAGQSYIDLYRLDDEKPDEMISNIRTVLTSMIQRDVSDAWWWIDAMYMAMPSFVRLGVLQEDTAFFHQAYKLYTDTKVTRGLYNEEDGLWYRDESFLPPYTTPNDSNSYWARGNGWVFGAHVRVLQLLPESDPHYEEYTSTFQHMAQALKQRQRADGFWNVSLDDPNDYGGPETSGTSFFTYGMAWGISEGLLDSAEYYPVIQKAWEAMTTLAVHDDGFLGYVQGVGVGPSSSQPVTYESTADFGVGAFLLAGSEVAKLATGAFPEPPTFWIKSTTVLDKQHVKIYFSQPPDLQSGLNPSSYTIDNGVEVLSASEDTTDVNACILEVSELAYGRYTLAATGLLSTTGDEIDEFKKSSFAYTGISVVDYSSYENNSNNIPENTLDVDLSTRWSALGDNQWVIYDLGALEVLDSVDIAFYSGNMRQAYITLEVSTDGEHFGSVFEGASGGQTIEPEPFNTSGSVARYLKLVGHGNSASEWNSVTEVRTYTSPLRAPTDILLSATQVEELAPKGTEVGIFTSEDADNLDVHLYALDSGAGGDDNALFVIEGDQLRTNVVFDFEEKATYSIRVRTEDVGGLTFSKIFTIGINDVDETPLAISGKNEKMSIATIYPVPVRDGVLLRVVVHEKKPVALRLYDGSGRLTVKKELGAGDNFIDLDGIPKGMYHLKLLQGDREIHHQKIVKE